MTFEHYAEIALLEHSRLQRLAFNPHGETTMARTAEQIVNAEVHYCVSNLVSLLAANMGATEMSEASRSMSDAAEQAFELCSPIDDWEEAAIQAGWQKSPVNGKWWHPTENDGSAYVDNANAFRNICEDHDIEPYQREVFEHWIVSDWLADRLAEKGEKVDKDFAGMTVWARTTTGQGIASDSVIEAIAADLNAS